MGALAQHAALAADVLPREYMPCYKKLADKGTRQHLILPLWFEFTEQTDLTEDGVEGGRSSVWFS